MNLTSCTNCGVVLDKDILRFPRKSELHDDHGVIIDSRAEWNGNDYVPKVSCPVCGESILEND